MKFLDLVVAAIIALPFELLAHMGWDRWKRWEKETKMIKKYSFLARRYRNLRNGITPTGGSIELTGNPDGSFSVTGLNADGSTEWQGKLRMSPDDEGVGSATYRYLSGTNHGTQRVVYVPLNDTLHVIGRNQSTTLHREFVHVWDPDIHIGKMLT